VNSNERIRRLESVINPIGCDTCRWWDERLTVVCGPDEEHCLRGEHCPQCGRRVPIRQTVTLHGVDLAWI
jgi:hypothetical protein